MKRLLGLLGLALVPALLTVPTAAPAQAIGPGDFEARTSKILSLGAQDKWSDVARLTNPKMLAWVRARDHRSMPPKCKKSVASRPGDAVYACLYVEAVDYSFAIPSKWWVFYRKVEGRWTLVNERIITSADAYRVRQNLLARAIKIWDFAMADDWASVARYATADTTQQLRQDVEEFTAVEGPFGPEDKPYRNEQVRDGFGYSYFGDYTSLLPYFRSDALRALRFERIGDRWVATGVIDLPDEI